MRKMKMCVKLSYLYEFWPAAAINLDVVGGITKSFS